MTEQLSTLEQELADNPDDEEAFARLEDRLWAEGNWQSVVALYNDRDRKASTDVDFSTLVQRLVEHAQQMEAGPEQSKAWLAVGDLYVHRLDADDEGMDAYQRAFDIHPHDTAPLQRARDLYRHRGEWDALLEICEIELQAASSPEVRCEVLIDIAQVAAEHLDDFAAATAALEKVVDEGGDDPFVDQLLGFYMEETTVEEGIRQALSRAEQALNEESGSDAAGAFIEAAQLEYDRYGGGVAEALRLARRALEADPEDGDARLIVEELSKEVGDEPAVNGEQGVAVPADSEAAVEVVDDAEGGEEAQQADAEEQGPRVEVFFDAIEPFDGSVAEARQVLTKDRTDLSALKTVREDLLEKGDAAGLVEVLEDSVRYFRKDDGEWEIMTELANLYWLQLGDDDKAEYYFKRLKLLDPNHEDVFKFYEAYYEGEGNWRKLFTLLAGRLEHIDDREEYRLIVEQLSEIAEFELQSPQKAIDVWKNFLREFPGDDDGRRRLRQLYEDNQKWNALVDLLKDESRRLEEEKTESIQERIGLLEEIADIYRTHLNVGTMVMNVMAEILELDPTHPTAFGELRELYASNRRFNDLADLLASAAERAADRGDVGTAVGYLLEVAEIWEERMNNRTQAVPYLERIVEIAPEEVGVREQLREIYEKRRDFSSLFDLRLQEARLLAEPEREDELVELLELTRGRLDDAEREERVLSALVEIRSDDLALVDELVEVRREIEDWEGVVEALEAKSSKVDGDECIEVLAAAARCSGEELEDADEAVRLWKTVLAEAGSHEEAFDELAAIYAGRREDDALEELYVEADRADELFGRFAQVADEHADDAVELHRRRMRIADELLDDPERVVVALEGVRDALDDPEPVHRELLDWYGRTGELAKEIETRRILLDGESDDEAAYSQMLTIAELEEERGEADTGLSWALKAFELQPERDEARERAEELGRQTGMLDLVVDQIELVVAESDDETLRESLWAFCARIQWHDLDQFDTAIDHYERLRERHPEDFEFLEALDELYEIVERPNDRIEVLETQIELLRQRGAADVDMVDQLAKIADVQRRHLNEMNAARETYSRILDLQSDHLGAIRGKKELHRIDESWRDVVDYLLREIPLAAYESPEEQWAAKLELADVYRKQMGDLHEALRYYGEILGENPEHEDALDAVRHLLAEDGLARDAAILLEPIFRDLQQPGPLAEALEARLRVSGDPFEEQEILDELIPLYAEELEQIEEAFEHAQRQFEIDPERDDIWLRFEQLGAKLNRWELIEEMFTDESPLQGQDSPTRYDLLRHLAAIREHQLQEKEAALEAWEKLHEYDPFDVPALEALERLHRRLDNRRELVDALLARAELVDVDDDRIELLTEAAEILFDELDEPEEATDVCRTILSVDPEHDQAVSMLRTLLRQQERWHDLDELLSEQAMQTLEPEKRREYSTRLAVLRFEELDDAVGAVDILCGLLDDDPGDDEIVEFAHSVERSLVDDEHRRDLHLELARSLEPVYRMRGEYERLDAMLQVRLEAESGEFERAEILDELVELRQKRLSDPEGALEALEQGVVLQPDDERRRKKLLEIASGLDRLPEALDTLEEAAEKTDPFVAGQIWRRLAKLASRRLDDARRAIDYYERVLDSDEGDLEILAKLERLFEQTGASERLCDNLLEQARYADPDDRVELLRRAATLQEHVLERPVDAIDSHRQILEMDPEDMKSINALEQLYEHDERYFDLVELWQRKVALLEETLQRVAVLERWAELVEAELDDVNQAIDVHRRILEEDPEHRKALEALERLLAAEMQWPEWAEVARRRLEHPAGLDPDERLRIELRLAEVHGDELYEVEEALALYRRILQRDSDQEDAIEALEALADQDNWLEEVAGDLVEIYRRQERWEDLVDLYQRRRDVAMDPEEQAAFDFQRGQLLRDRLERDDEAMEAFAGAWKIEIDDDRYRSALIDLGTKTESWRLLVDLIEECLEVVVAPDMLRELHMMLAGLWQQMLDEPMEAEAHLREVLSAEPGHTEAFETLAELLEAGERWHDLVDLLEDRYSVVAADDEQMASELLMTIAGLQEEMLDDGVGAVETLRRVLVIDERHSEANEDMERLLTEQERWEDLARYYERRAEETPLPSERLESELALADLYRGPLQQIERALELYGHALDIDAEHERAIEALEAIFEEQPQFRADVASYLEPVYRSRSDEEALVRMLQARADASDDPDERADWLREILELLDTSVDDPKGAWIAAADLFSDHPDDEWARERLWSLTRRAEAWQSLASVYELVLEKKLALSDELRSELVVDLDHIYADHLEDVTRGRDLAEKALQLCPDSATAADEVERLLERERAWLDLADFYRDRAQFSADQDQTRRWYEKLAALYEDVLDDVDATVDVYARLLELVPGNEEYRSAMERILATVERWYDLADIYRQRVAAAPPESEVAIRNRMALAELVRKELDSPDEAVDLYGQILEVRPGDSDAIRALEGMRRDLDSREGDWRPLKRRIIEILLNAYDDTRSWRRVDDLLDEQVELTDDSGEQVEILVDKAQLLLRSTQDTIERVHALTTLARAYCLDPTNDEIEDLIEVLAEDLEAWQRIVPIYLRALGQTDDVDRQGLILAAVAQIYEYRIGDMESAVAAYQQSVEISAESEIALEKLQELYGAMEKWAPLVDILERRIDEIVDPDQRQSLRKRVARIYDERLDEPEEALRLYREIRAEEPSELSHLVVIERLYESIGDFEALEQLLLEKLDFVDADSLRARTFKHLGAIRRDELDKIDSAIASFHDALEVTPDDVEALDALMELYRDAERWSELLDVMRSRRDETEDIDAVNEFDIEMGDVLADKLDDADGAYEHYRAVLGRDHQNYQARGALFRLLADERIRRKAAEALVELHEADEEWDELEALYLRLIELSDDSDYVAEQYLALARMQEELLGVGLKAFVTLGEAMNDVPQSEEVRRKLERLAEEHASADDLLAIYEEALEGGVDDPEVRRELHLGVGRAYAEQAEDFDSAIPHFEAVLEVDDFDREALDWLDRIYQAKRDWDNLVPVLEDKIAVVDGEDELQAIFQLGYLREVVYEEHREAFEHYRDVLHSIPDHTGSIEGLGRIFELEQDEQLRADILELLEPIFRDRQEWAKLVGVFDKKLEVVDDPVRRGQLLREMAQIEYEELDRVHVAFEHWSQALELEPQDVQVQETLEELAAEHALYEELVDLYEDVAQAVDDPMRTLELAEKAGKWCIERLGERSRSTTSYRLVLEVQPEHEEALEILEDVAREEGDDASLAAVLAARIHSTTDSDEQIAMYNELASLQLGIEDYDGAIAALEALQELDGVELERLETLAGLYEATERWESRVQALEQLLEYRDDHELRLATFVEIGTISLEALEDAAQAQSAFERAQELDPDDGEVLEGLSRAYEERGDWQRLEATLGQQLENTSQQNDEERIRLYIRRAGLRYERANDVDRAIEDYQRAHAIRPDHPDVVDALESMYRSEGRWEDLLGLLTECVNNAPDQETALTHLLEMAAVAHEEIGAADRAVEFAHSVLEVDMANEAALDRLETIHRSRGQWDEVVGVIDHRIELADDDADELERLIRQRARTLDEDAGALEAAASTYEMILEYHPGDGEILDRLEEIYDELDDGDGIYGLLARRAEMAEDDEERAELYLKMAETARTRLDDPDRRIAALEAARDLRGNEDLDVVEPLLDAYIDGEQFDMAEPILESLIDSLTEARKMKEVVRFHHLRGKLAERQGDVATATAAYEEAHRLDATYIPNLLSLAKLQFRTEDYEGAKKTFQVLLLHQMNIKDKSDKVDVYYHLGAVREAQGDAKGAREMYKRALRVDSSHGPTNEAMERLG